MEKSEQIEEDFYRIYTSRNFTRNHEKTEEVIDPISVFLFEILSLHCLEKTNLAAGNLGRHSLKDALEASGIAEEDFLQLTTKLTAERNESMASHGYISVPDGSISDLEEMYEQFGSQLMQVDEMLNYISFTPNLVDGNELSYIGSSPVGVEDHGVFSDLASIYSSEIGYIRVIEKNLVDENSNMIYVLPEEALNQTLNGTKLSVTISKEENGGISSSQIEWHNKNTQHAYEIYSNAPLKISDSSSPEIGVISDIINSMNGG